MLESSNTERVDKKEGLNTGWQAQRNDRLALPLGPRPATGLVGNLLPRRCRAAGNALFAVPARGVRGGGRGGQRHRPSTMYVLRQMRARRRIGGLKAEKEKVAATVEIKTELVHRKREVTPPPPSKEEIIFRCRTRG